VTLGTRARSLKRCPDARCRDRQVDYSQIARL
jgi:hypothetical protein